MKQFFGKPPKGGHGGRPPEMPIQDVSHIKNKKLDLRYGDAHPRQVFDIYYPEHGEGPFPVLLHIHGGGFAMGDKRDFHIKDLLGAIERGYALASCNYRRSGDAPFPAAVLDCRSFAAYIKAHASELNILPDKICAFGGSAGGNIAALLAMNIPQFIGEAEPIDARISCAVDWFGPTDFLLMDEQARANGVSIPDHDAPDSPESKYVGGTLQEVDPAFVEKANPISYITEGMCPLLIQHGRRDVLVPFEQSEILYDAIEKKLGKGRAVFLPLDNAGHDDPQFKSAENMDIVWAFMAEHLKPPKGDKPFRIPSLASDILDAINEKHLDIPYATQSDSQKLDLYLPNERPSGLLPVIVHFHGGAFMFGTKRDDNLEPMLRGLERGYAVISAEYRKSGEARFPAMVYDAKAVIRWVRANAARYGLDPEKIAVWGPSSGGWLSSFVAVTNGNPAFEDLSQGNDGFDSRVHACIDWCGPCAGFLAMDEAFRLSGAGMPDHDEADSPESRFLGAKITHVPELVRLSAPVTHVSKDVAPFLIIHGGADSVVPVEQSIAFAAAIVRVAGAERVKLHIAEGKPHHGNPWYNETWVSDMCLDFLDGELKKKP